MHSRKKREGCNFKLNYVFDLLFNSVLSSFTICIHTGGKKKIEKFHHVTKQSAVFSNSLHIAFTAPLTLSFKRKLPSSVHIELFCNMNMKLESNNGGKGGDEKYIIAMR